MFISPAYAQAAGGLGGDLGTQLLPILLMFAIFYFLLIRPQQKKMKAHKAKLAGTRRGDRVVTGGGIIGTVSKVDDDSGEITVEIAPDVKVKIQRELLADVLSKTEAVDASAQKSVGAANDDKKSGGLLANFFGGKKKD